MYLFFNHPCIRLYIFAFPLSFVCGELCSSSLLQFFFFILSKWVSLIMFCAVCMLIHIDPAISRRTWLKPLICKVCVLVVTWCCWLLAGLARLRVCVCVYFVCVPFKKCTLPIPPMLFSLTISNCEYALWCVWSESITFFFVTVSWHLWHLSFLFGRHCTIGD